MTVGKLGLFKTIVKKVLENTFLRVIKALKR